MTDRILGNTNRLFICLLILLGFSSVAFSFQTKISGTSDNKYGRVTSLGTDFVIVNDPLQFSQFAAGDTVLIIQMKGVKAKVGEDSNFGNWQDMVGSTGKYEFLTIISIDVGLKKIVFRNNIINAYNVSGDVQIVKIPSYNSVLVDGDLTCAAWDSTKHTGGVLSLIVRKTIRLNANIDVTGKGFMGGGTASGDAVCVNSNLSAYDKFSFPGSGTNSGFKGESPASIGWVDFSTEYPIFPAYSKGKGANFSGGGGGNGNLSGGGGGASYGTGGRGGLENNSCLPTYIPVAGGLGGRQLKNTDLDSCILFGAGGGSSSYTAGASPAPGGNGGGIIIIICDSITGNGKIIRADGAGALTPTGNTGAGGGGGGGTIALYLTGFNPSNLTIAANGGKGGDNPGKLYGEGGGGGGGRVMINNITIPANVLVKVDSGLAGTRSGAATATYGARGSIKNHYVALLNGFLFNSIHSSVTGDELDSICSNIKPPKIIGTRPVGGSGKYVYLWQKSIDGLTWSAIANPDSTNYEPSTPEINTVWYRRTITDFYNSTLSDTSKPVKIIVQPFIKNNIVGNSDTLCYNQDPPLIQQLLPNVTDGNNKSYYYKWQVSTDSATWSASVASTLNYDPPAGLLVTTWYRRTVTSGRCIDSAASAKMTVLTAIASNKLISPSQEICHGMLFNDLTATVAPVLKGGDNSYRFKWESSADGSAWVTATGVNNGAGYNPDELTFSSPGIQYFRRIVYSGNHNVCVSNSDSVVLKDFPVITNNIISGAQTIGHDSVPATLTGNPPGNGNLSYLYLWQSRIRGQSWGPAPGVNTAPNFSPAALTDTTWYRRVVKSSACSDTSNVIVINVHKTITDNSVSFASGAVEDTICNGAAPAILKGSVPAGGSGIPPYKFQWYYSTNNATWNMVPSAGTSQDYQPGTLTAGATWFRRHVSSPADIPTSTSVSNSIKITVLPLITNKNISADQMVCIGSPLPPLTSAGGGPAGGDGTFRYTWRQDSAGSGWKDIPGWVMTAASSYSRTSIKDPFRYIRYIYSGKHNACSDSSNYVSVGINQLPTGAITTLSDTTVCGGLAVPVKIHLTGASKWRLVYEENSGIRTTINKILRPDTTILISRIPSGVMSTYTIRVDSLSDANNCKALPAALTGQRNIVVYKMPKAEAGNSPDSVCGPDYQLSAARSIATGTGAWSWTKITSASVPAGPLFTPGASDPNAKVTVDLTTTEWNLRYKFIWRETNAICSDKDSVTIRFFKPTDKLKSDSTKTLFTSSKKDTLIALTPLVGTGVWTQVKTGDKFSNNSVVSSLESGDNKFEWKITNGLCSSIMDYTIKVYDVKIPQGFSPNGDGINDEFIIEGLDREFNEVTLNIRNSAGSEVFHASNAGGNDSWSDFKGENSEGKPLPEGTYYYFLTIKPSDSPAKQWNGFIVLKRYISK
jgi:gliding motility-associated-like protein